MGLRFSFCTACWALSSKDTNSRADARRARQRRGYDPIVYLESSSSASLLPSSSGSSESPAASAAAFLAASIASAAARRLRRRPPPSPPRWDRQAWSVRGYRSYPRRFDRTAQPFVVFRERRALLHEALHLAAELLILLRQAAHARAELLALRLLAQSRPPRALPVRLLSTLTLQLAFVRLRRRVSASRIRRGPDGGGASFPPPPPPVLPPPCRR